MTDHEYLWRRRHEVKVRALTTRFYYQERQRIFEFRECAIKALSLFASTVAFANLTSPEVIQACAAAIAGGSVSSLVFGFGAKARDSARRSAEWAFVERDIEAAGERDFTEAHVNSWYARANEIEAGEPAAHAGLFERCYQRACIAIGATPDGKASWWQANMPPLMIP